MAERPGLYTRVLQTGTIQTGDSVEWIAASADNPTVNDLLSLYYAKDYAVAQLEQMLAAPISDRSRRLFEARREQLVA
jgi:MOSC domain-containing protein YiiM